MQLSNKINGKVIEIYKIRYNTNSILYQVYEFGGDNKQKVIEPKNHKFETIVFYDYLFSADNLGTIILLALKDELSLNDYVLEIDNKNWLKENRPIRLIMEKNWVTNDVFSLAEHKELSLIIDREKNANIDLIEQGGEGERFVFFGDKYIVAYFFEVTTEDENVILQYINNGKIIIENK